MSGRAARLLVLAAVLLGLGALAAPPSAPPLYDGVNYPDEPYRFVDPPAGARTTKAPTTATATVPVRAGQAAAVTLATAEDAPQLRIDLPAGAARTPEAVTTVTLRAAPVPDIAVPGGKYLWSDVYDVSATRGSVTSISDAGGQPTITMRAVNAQRPEPVIALFDGRSWTMLPTIAVGNDIYSAQLPGLGTFAVLGDAPLALTSPDGQGISRSYGLLIAIGVLLVIVALIAVRVRRRARRHIAPDGDVDGNEPG